MAVALRDLEREHQRGRPALRVVPAPPGPPRPSRRVFWLRRVLVVVVVVMVACAGAAVVRAASGGAGEPVGRVDVTVVIPEGGTLWDLAARYAPAQTDRGAWVASVAERNALDPGAAILPGTAVTVPVDAQRVTARPLSQ